MSACQLCKSGVPLVKEIERWRCHIVCEGATCYTIPCDEGERAKMEADSRRLEEIRLAGQFEGGRSA